MYFLSSRSGTANKTSNVGINAQNARYKALRFPKMGSKPFQCRNWNITFSDDGRNSPNFWGVHYLEVVRSWRYWGKWGNGKRDWIEDGDGGQPVKLGLRLGNNANSFTARRGTAWWRGTEVARTAQGARPGGPRWHVANLNGSSWGKLPRFYGHNKKVWSVWLRVVLHNFTLARRRFIYPCICYHVIQIKITCLIS